MPAKSEKQAVAARIAKAVKQGKAKAKPGSASAKMAKGMTEKQLSHYTKSPKGGEDAKTESLTVAQDVEVVLDGNRYLLEVGDVLMVEKKIDGREVEYPCTDKKHTQSAIGYIMKYKNAKAGRNKAKVARAAKKFGIELPEGWGSA